MRSGLLVAIVMLATTAAANPDIAPPEAMQLFREGRELMKAHQLDAACDRFARSQKLAPRVGTLLNLGECYEQRGMIASAFAAFVEAKALAARTNDARAAEAQKRLEILEIDIPYVTLIVKQQIPSLVIERNGRAVDPATWNIRAALDPGEYELTAHAQGYKPWAARRAIAKREAIEVVVDLAPDPTAKAPVVDVPAPKRLALRSVAFGVLGGSNTRERYLIGGRVLGNLLSISPDFVLRGSASFVYSRYADALGTPPMDVTVTTLYIGGAFDVLWRLAPQYSVAAGVWLGIERDKDPNNSDVAGALAIRASPVIVHLLRNRAEADLQLQLAFAGSEVTLHLLAGFAWYL